MCSWLGPTRVPNPTIWPDADYAHVVCSVDEGNACSRVILVPNSQLPDGTTPPIRICSRSGPQIVDCLFYGVGLAFVYQASIPAPNALPRLAQSGKISLDDPSSWSIFLIRDQSTHWLTLARISPGVSTTRSSFDIQIQINIQRPCSADNCVGCASLAVQRVCYAAQQCQLARCIGTMVHQRRPLCAIGMTLAAMVDQETAIMHGTWLIVAETMVGVLALSGGVTPPTAIAWPDQAFYGFICSAKDISATGISIVMASINGVVQSVGQIPIAESSRQTHLIDNRALALFTMTTTAVTNLLHQIALAPLYTMIAVQKTMVCSANSVMSVMDQSGSITIGDPTIQDASAIAAGRCMSQYVAGNIQGGASGTDNGLSIAKSAVQALSLNIGLDYLIHPFDTTFTWLQGCVSGLQDVVETLDRSKCVCTTATNAPPTPPLPFFCDSPPRSRHTEPPHTRYSTTHTRTPLGPPLFRRTRPCTSTGRRPGMCRSCYTENPGGTPG